LIESSLKPWRILAWLLIAGGTAAAVMGLRDVTTSWWEQRQAGISEAGIHAADGSIAFPPGFEKESALI